MRARDIEINSFPYGLSLRRRCLAAFSLALQAQTAARGPKLALTRGRRLQNLFAKRPANAKANAKGKEQGMRYECMRLNEPLAVLFLLLDS